MKKRLGWIILILVILIAFGIYVVMTRSSGPISPYNAKVIQTIDDSAACGPDSEPQCLDHSIGQSCTNVRDGNIPGVCKESYDYRACVCR